MDTSASHSPDCAAVMVVIPDKHGNHMERAAWLLRGSHVHLRHRFTSSSSQQVYPMITACFYHSTQLF
jgi:hypothetical protein